MGTLNLNKSSIVQGLEVEEEERGISDGSNVS